MDDPNDLPARGALVEDGAQLRVDGGFGRPTVEDGAVQGGADDGEGAPVGPFDGQHDFGPVRRDGRDLGQLSQAPGGSQPLAVSVQLPKW